MRFDAAPDFSNIGDLNPLKVSVADIEAWLLRKEPQAIGSWNEIGAEEYARSFTAARTAGTDIADDLYYGLVDVVSGGGSFDDFSKLVTPILKQKGWLGGDDGTIAQRVGLIYDTNINLARAAGDWDRTQATKATLPYIRAFTVGDGRVRHPPKSPHSDHRAWQDIVLPVDHPFWLTYWPPLGFRCRCGIMQLTRSQFARLKVGITSEDELAERIARLGPPVFASPGLPIAQQLQAMAANSNERRMPGMPAVDPLSTDTAGRSFWRDVIAEAAYQELSSFIDKLFGIAA